MTGARRTRPSARGALLLMTAVFLAGCAASTTAGPLGPAPSRAQATAALTSLRDQASEILDGGPTAFRRRIGSLRGYPVVVNQWASWCGPCRYEFPFFQHLARRYQGRVAFIGVDSKDARSDASGFLKQLPIPYPSYFDPDASIARFFRGGFAWPTTAFFNRDGHVIYVHLGAYASEAKLDADVKHYAALG
jgi:cytochrome c biogenesis protein CcmG/thiol:disulfide interchange protein DsbE